MGIESSSDIDHGLQLWNSELPVFMAALHPSPQEQSTVPPSLVHKVANEEDVETAARDGHSRFVVGNEAVLWQAAALTS